MVPLSLPLFRSGAAWLYCWNVRPAAKRLHESERSMEGGTLGEGGRETVSADEFQALEAKVLQTVELIRREREARAVAEAERNAAEAEAAALRERLMALEEANGTARTELEAYHDQRELVRNRVERLLAQMDELL